MNKEIDQFDDDFPIPDDPEYNAYLDSFYGCEHGPDDYDMPPGIGIQVAVGKVWIAKFGPLFGKPNATGEFGSFDAALNWLVKVSEGGILRRISLKKHWLVRFADETMVASICMEARV